MQQLNKINQNSQVSQGNFPNYYTQQHGYRTHIEIKAMQDCKWLMPLHWKCFGPGKHLTTWSNVKQCVNARWAKYSTEKKLLDETEVLLEEFVTLPRIAFLGLVLRSAEYSTLIGSGPKPLKFSVVKLFRDLFWERWNQCLGSFEWQKDVLINETAQEFIIAQLFSGKEGGNLSFSTTLRKIGHQESCALAQTTGIREMGCKEALRNVDRVTLALFYICFYITHHCGSWVLSVVC